MSAPKIKPSAQGKCIHGTRIGSPCKRCFKRTTDILTQELASLYNQGEINYRKVKNESLATELKCSYDELQNYLASSTRQEKQDIEREHGESYRIYLIYKKQLDKAKEQFFKYYKTES